MKPTSRAPHVHHPPEEMHNDGVAHEHSDVNIRAILGFGGIVVAVTVVCALLVWGLFGLLESQAAARDPKMSPLAIPAAQMPRTTTASPFFGNAPQPQLMTNEPEVLRIQRQAEEQRLHQYGWVEQGAGVAHVPIDQAKKLILERGLPSRAATVDGQMGTHAPAFGEASSGRSIPTGELPARATAPAEPAQATEPAPKEAPAHAPAGRGSGV